MLSFHEHPLDKNAFFFDPALLNVSSGTTLNGYLQSYKYFHPHAMGAIKALYTIPPWAERSATAFIESVRKELANGNGSRVWRLVGVNVRLGDKRANNFYNSWALSEHYYFKTLSLVRSLNPSDQIAYIFFTGGATAAKDIIRDRQWTVDKLALNLTNVFNEESGQHLVSLKSIRLCDIIITAHSTLSWWAAYLSTIVKPHNVFAPLHLFPRHATKFVAEDFYLPGWQLLSDNFTEDPVSSSVI